ncbi:hypothetical protein PV379_03770 [Streptomyces caniscabiei]|uniref:hypothetical protein n=1 Tax=Streptomyces caniscabiei TaxID=2746961 RepID=UPI0029B0C1B8|nr:hypothetical protein [Streptomyces caniscabiei]MDX2776458.1 hypothetical protein [Streptomyces caniscabiei]
MNDLLRRFVFGFLIAGVLVVLFGSGTHAESGQAFTISPPLVELNANPGQTVEATIKLTNVSAGTLSITTQANDFGSKNETGEPNIIFDDKEPPPYTLKGWVGVPDDFTLASKETRTLTVPIAVPVTAEPGGHYGVIRFTGASAADGQNDVALSASIGTLVLLRVSGDIKQDAKVEEFYSAASDFSKQSFFEAGPVTLVGRIRNDGNIHVKPTGTITIKDMYGNVIKTLRMNGDPSSNTDQPRSILPQSVRRFDTELKDLQLFGNYTATMKLTYGDGKTLSSETTFWVVPVKMIVLVVAGLAIVGTLFVVGMKKYNAHIIKKAQDKSGTPK